MANASDIGKTQIIVAMIGVSGVIAAALIANWDKIFHDRAPQAAVAKQDPTSRPPGAATVAPADAAAKIGNAGIADVSGIWRDQFGQEYSYAQSGADYTYRWFQNGGLAGSGSGRLAGREFTGRFELANGTAGTCSGKIDGGRVISTCEAGGKSFPMLLTR